MDQPTLFAPVDPVDPRQVSPIGQIAPSVDPVARHCSAMGALDVATRAAAQRDRLEGAYRVMGPMTDQEMAAFLGLERSSVIPRRTELMAAGKVGRAGVKRNPVTGISNTTWQLTR